ncbi:MAG: hypothetical protein RLZZ01_1164, partial [Actinomycetota bacterium]
IVSVGVLVLAVAPTRSELIDIANGDDGFAAVAQTVITRLDVADATTVAALATPVRAAGAAFPSRLALVTAGDLIDDRSAGATDDTAVSPVPERGSPVEVAVPSGRTHTAVVIGHAGDAVIVRLEHDEPALAIRSVPLSVDEPVTVLSSPPLTVALGELDSLDVAEGTAVVDRSGALIGLCTLRDRSRVGLVTIDDRSINSPLDGATSGG